MTLTDHNLADLVAMLTEPTRRLLYAHVLFGLQTDESWAALRWLRRRLKRKARSRR